jgi:hypothetical protein
MNDSRRVTSIGGRQMERVDYESMLVQEVIQSHGSGALDINPWYQRRSVWSDPQKSYLINTLFEKKPIPSIYIRHQIDPINETSIKEVVDGQQRVRAILSYRAGEFGARHPGRNNRRVRYGDLTPAERTNFLSTKISVGYLIEADDKDVIEIFGRINSISKTLNPQEKRNALFSGEFKQLTLKLAAELTPFWRRTGIFTGNDIARMQEVQFVSDVVHNMINGLSDFSAYALTRTYSLFDDDFPLEEDIAQRWNDIFSLLVQLEDHRLRDSIFRVPQIFFSLLLTLDGGRVNPLSLRQIDEFIVAADQNIATLQERAHISEAERQRLEAFSGGNLHRIRARRARADFLSSLVPD